MHFESLNETSRLWVFPLTGRVSESFSDKLQSFISSWKAHGAPMRGAVELIDNQIVLIAADESDVQASGCSIDKLTSEVTKLAQEESVALATGGETLFKSESGWNVVSRRGFQQLASEKKVTPETLVVDSTLTALSQLRDGGVVKPVSESWYSKAFKF